MCVTRRAVLHAGAAALAAPALPAVGRAQERTQPRAWKHGLSLFGDLKYSEGFKQFEYVNAGAPKGGVARQIAFGTFDNFNSVVAGVKGTMIPTLLGILLVSFVVVQFAPGGPVERVIAQLSGTDTGASSRIPGAGSGGDFGTRGAQGGSQIDSVSSKYRGAQGLDPEFIKKLEVQFGFDKPAYERFFLMLKNFLTFDFGKSYFRDVSVMQLIKEKLPVSMSLGIWMTLLTYLISIPLGIKKAVTDGTRFDVWTSGVIIIGYAIPGFLVAILLIILFAGGSYYDLFPLRGLTSDNWSQMAWWQKILDYFWHLTLPIIAMSSSLMVMKEGKVMEAGPAAQLFKSPKTAYTRALFAAAFNIEASAESATAQ